MRRIFKYVLNINGTTTPPLPQDSQILSIGGQGDSICIWAETDPDSSDSPARKFVSFATGMGVHLQPSDINFIGTAHLHNSKTIFHVYELVKAS